MPCSDAGVYEVAAFGRLTQDHFETLDPKVRDALFVLQKSLPPPSSGACAALTVSSRRSRGFRPCAGTSGQRRFDRSWIVTLEGARAHALSPGHIATPGASRPSAEKRATPAADTVPLGRRGPWDELRTVAVLLASDDRSYGNAGEPAADDGVAQV